MNGCLTDERTSFSFLTWSTCLSLSTSEMVSILSAKKSVVGECWTRTTRPNVPVPAALCAHVLINSSTNNQCEYSLDLWRYLQYVASYHLFKYSYDITVTLRRLTSCNLSLNLRLGLRHTGYICLFW